MGFTTQLFLFVFFPCCITAFLTVQWLQSRKFFTGILQKLRAKDLVLVAFSLAFYMWACFDDVLRLCIYILAVYGAGRWIQGSRKKGRYLTLVNQDSATPVVLVPVTRFVLTICILGLVGCLVQYKYTTLLADLWNYLFRDTVQRKSVMAPIGISFITFSAVSYLVDIYRGKATAGSLIDCALYISFFPKVVSGPVVFWQDFQPQIKSGQTSLASATDGLNRIMIGFAKKLLLADQFGACIARISDSYIDPVSAWGSSLLYMLQLYYDFSGYSDIAIGLTKLFGFEFKENFHFPYLSKSVSEFWRRWHISLGAWFREYIYIPSGGSRAGKRKTLCNLAVIFVLTGIWHGAGWNYMLWGAINGGFVIAERLLKNNRLYQRTPGVIKWAATMLITFFGWQVFRCQGLGELTHWLKVMCGSVTFSTIPYSWRYFFDSQTVTLMVVGILGATVLGLPWIQKQYQRAVASRLGYALQQLLFVVVFIVSVLFMVNSTYSPFIYFQY